MFQQIYEKKNRLSNNEHPVQFASASPPNPIQKVKHTEF